MSRTPPQQPWPPAGGQPGYPPSAPGQPAYGRPPYAQPPVAPMAALTSGPVGGSPRQWEARVARMIRNGQTRDQIIPQMTVANWPFDQADAMVKRLAGRERWAAGTILAGTGLVGLLGAGLFALILAAGNAEMFGLAAGLIVFGVSGAIYGLVRLTKIRC